MGESFLCGVSFVGLFIFFTLLLEILRLRIKLYNLQHNYKVLDNYIRDVIYKHEQNSVLHKVGLVVHTKQMIEFVDMLYYTEDNIPKYGKKLADLVLGSKVDGTLYKYFLSLLSQYNITEGNVYDKLKQEYALAEKDILICALLNHGFTSHQIWTIYNSNENAYYTRCSRLRTKLRLAQESSISDFVKEYVETNLSELKLLHK